MSDTSLITGPVGTLEGFFDAVKAKLDEANSSWQDLASRLGVSRQYITRVTREPAISLDHVLSICSSVGLDPFDVIDPTSFVADLAKRACEERCEELIKARLGALERKHAEHLARLGEEALGATPEMTTAQSQHHLL